MFTELSSQYPSHCLQVSTMTNQMGVHVPFHTTYHTSSLPVCADFSTRIAPHHANRIASYHTSFSTTVTTIPFMPTTQVAPQQVLSPSTLIAHHPQRSSTLHPGNLCALSSQIKMLKSLKLIPAKSSSFQNHQNFYPLIIVTLRCSLLPVHLSSYNHNYFYSKYSGY